MADPRSLYVHLDARTLEAARRALQGSGLLTNDAVELLLTRIARDKALPFDPALSDLERPLAQQAGRAMPSSGQDAFVFLVNERVADEAARVLDTLGLSIDEAVGLMMAYTAQGVVLPLLPNTTTVAAMEAVERGEVFSSNSVEDLLADLNADD